MTLKRTIALPLAALALIGAGLSIGAALPTRGVEAPTPAASVPFTLPEPFASGVRCTEDEPCWDCETMGNMICGDLTEAQRAAGWAVFDAAGGAGHLLVNPHARVTLTGYARISPYDQGAPVLAVNQLALPGAEVWFVYDATAL
jgi:hypothetical protein